MKIEDKMKIKVCLCFAAALLFFSQAGCGGSSYSGNSADYSAVKEESAAAGEGLSDAAADEYQYDDADENGAEYDGTEDLDEEVSAQTANIDLDMLVYRCNVNIDTLDYKNSYASLLKLIDKYQGFIESSDYSDGGSAYTYYYIEPSDKHSECTITTRIPSKQYEKFISSFGDLGDVRSMNANVENVTQEYKDSKTALKIYREQEKRYISMIADADPSYALELQNELSDLEIKIAQLESRIQNIKNDVAYSYVTINLREVEKYSLHGNTDTFTMRLKDSWSDSWQSFCGFLESVLIFFIYAWYYIVLIIIIVVVVRKLRKAWRKKHPAREKRHKKQGLEADEEPED